MDTILYTHMLLIPGDTFVIKYLTCAICVFFTESSLSFQLLIDQKVILQYVQPYLNAEENRNGQSPLLRTGTVDIWNGLKAEKDRHIDNLTLNMHHSQQIEESSLCYIVLF